MVHVTTFFPLSSLSLSLTPPCVRTHLASAFSFFLLFLNMSFVLLFGPIVSHQFIKFIPFSSFYFGCFQRPHHPHHFLTPLSFLFLLCFLFSFLHQWSILWSLCTTSTNSAPCILCTCSSSFGCLPSVFSSSSSSTLFCFLTSSRHLSRSRDLLHICAFLRAHPGRCASPSSLRTIHFTEPILESCGCRLPGCLKGCRVLFLAVFFGGFQVFTQAVSLFFLNLLTPFHLLLRVLLLFATVVAVAAVGVTEILPACLFFHLRLRVN